MTRRTWTVFGAANFFFGGCGIAVQNGFLRITGHKENAPERRRFGIIEPLASSTATTPRESTPATTENVKQH